jgi:hypothetical protein
MVKVEAEGRVGEKGPAGAERAAPADIACPALFAAPPVAANERATLRGHRSLNRARTSPRRRLGDIASGTCTTRASSSPRRPRAASACPGACDRGCVREQLREC